MDNRAEEMSDRMFEFAVAVVEVVNRLPQTIAGRNIGVQLLKAGTSRPANNEEARAAESRADFLHKLQVALKELREARFWLRLIHRTRMVPEDIVTPVYGESMELCNIIGKSVVTAKGRS